MSPKCTNDLQSDLWISICSLLTSGDMTNEKKQSGDLKQYRRCYTPEMSDSIVYLQRSNHSGLSALETCLDLFSLCCHRC